MRANLGESYQKRLFAAAIRLDRRLFAKPYEDPGWLERRFVVLFNLIGVLFGFFTVKIALRRTANLVTAGFALLKARRIPHPLSSESARNLEQAKRLIEAYRKKTRKRPAVLIVMSHPQTAGDESRLLGDMIYHAVQISNTITPKSRFKFLQAIDDFALDTLAWPAAAFYAGAIASAHLAVDRMPEERTLLQRALFRRFGYNRTIFRFVKALKRRRTICAALGGGVIHNTRIVYTIREYAQRVWGLAQKRTFAKQEFVLKVVEILTREEACAAVTGSLSDSERTGLLEFFRREAVPESALPGLAQELEEELKLETPYRQRLFRVVFRYTCGRGIPLLLIPLRHRRDGTLLLSPARLLLRLDRKKARLTLADGEDLAETESDSREFVRDFIRNSMND